MIIKKNHVKQNLIYTNSKLSCILLTLLRCRHSSVFLWIQKLHHVSENYQLRLQYVSNANYDTIFDLSCGMYKMWTSCCCRVTVPRLSHIRFLSFPPSAQKPLTSFIVLVGRNSSWQILLLSAAACATGAFVEYPCETLRLGHLVSINKTTSAELDRTFRMLLLREVQVFGYKRGMMILAI